MVPHNPRRQRGEFNRSRYTGPMEMDYGPVCRQHLEFMKWADDTMLAALQQVPPDKLTYDHRNSFNSLLDTLNHVYLAELVWLKRVQENPNARIGDLESPASIEALAKAWPEVHQRWLNWSRSFSSTDWKNNLTYSNSEGIQSHRPYWQIALHLVNHGTDLITFYRTQTA
jgi:uncharacterized damage-inducible protein DinB